jgi:hypothetical protein
MQSHCHMLYKSNNNKNNTHEALTSYDELETCRTSLVFAEQPVMCIHVRLTNAAYAPCSRQHVIDMPIIAVPVLELVCV